MTVSRNPWQAPPDDSYWQALLSAEDDVAPADRPGEGEDAPADEMASVLGTEPGSNLDQNAQTSAFEGDWERAMVTQEQNAVAHLSVTGYNRGGLLVRFGSLQGFVPASQLLDVPHQIENEARKASLARRVGETLSLRIIELNQERNRLIFSERAAQRQEETQDSLDDLKPGAVCTGRVTSVCGFGAFVDLGELEGLIHISELSWGRVNHPKDILEVGQSVQVYVLGVEEVQHRVALSLKRLKPNPWSTVEERYEVGQIVEGVITNVVNFGAFARIEDGLEGLVHISELAEGNFLHPRNVVREGDRVKVRVLNIDSRNHRLGLSLRQSSRNENHRGEE
jgi:small subunit ribosomal protein S1